MPACLQVQETLNRLFHATDSAAHSAWPSRHALPPSAWQSPAGGRLSALQAASLQPPAGDGSDLWHSAASWQPGSSETSHMVSARSTASWAQEPRGSDSCAAPSGGLSGMFALPHAGGVLTQPGAAGGHGSPQERLVYTADDARLRRSSGGGGGGSSRRSPQQHQQQWAMQAALRETSEALLAHAGGGAAYAAARLSTSGVSRRASPVAADSVPSAPCSYATAARRLSWTAVREPILHGAVPQAAAGAADARQTLSSWEARKQRGSQAQEGSAGKEGSALGGEGGLGCSEGGGLAAHWPA